MDKSNVSRYGKLDRICGKLFIVDFCISVSSSACLKYELSSLSIVEELSMPMLNRIERVWRGKVIVFERYTAKDESGLEHMKYLSRL